MIREIHKIAVESWVFIKTIDKKSNPALLIFMHLVGLNLNRQLIIPDNIIDLCDTINEFNGLSPLTKGEKNEIKKYYNDFSGAYKTSKKDNIFNTIDLRIFNKLIFKRRHILTLSNLNEKLNLGKYFYSISYNEIYSQFLDGVSNPKLAISELFVFRTWTTQFGFKIFSSDPDISLQIVREVFRKGIAGKNILKNYAGIDIELETRSDYDDLINDRWNIYNYVLDQFPNPGKQIPTIELCSKLSSLCMVSDPIKTVFLSTEFLKHMYRIKQEATILGLLR